MVGRFHPLAPCRPYHLSLHLPCPLFSRAMDGEGMGCAGGKWSRERTGGRKGPTSGSKVRPRSPRLELRSGPGTSKRRRPFFYSTHQKRPDSSLPHHVNGDRGIRGVSNAGTTSSVQILSSVLTRSGMPGRSLARGILHRASRA